MERWVKTLRGELLDRTLIWNEAHLGHALKVYEHHYNERRTHRPLGSAAPGPAGPAHWPRSACVRPAACSHATAGRAGCLGRTPAGRRTAAVPRPVAAPPTATARRCWSTPQPPAWLT
ncbi:integrase core domain-containing protein [Lentzea alba]|uniref:integrase core domain-containing protein n=1 Tax=Lentzea alba TaxID=2714351 RepID=UPI001F5FC643|nr:integrase core domain-containing protein [Lentzea alba]